jgi:tRNA (guanine-N7-)-methyltransferase
MEESQSRRRIRSYVLRAGRLSTGQKRAIEELSGTYCIEFKQELLDYSEIYSNKNPLIIEIGFGMGDATSRIAETFPDQNYLGIEVYAPGVGKLLSEIEQKELSNVRIIQHDAVDVLNTMIGDDSIAGFHIFFPDPWPKKKHHKRRLIQRQQVDLLSQKLISGGYIYAVTDWEDYAQQMLEVFSDTPDLDNAYQGYAKTVSWRPRTKFEQKGLHKEHLIRELWFVKK